MLENGRSREMVRKVLTNLKTLISFAQGEGLVAHNVAREVKFRRSDRDDEPIEIPSKDEIRRLINTVDGRWRPIIVTAIFTGLRASELRGLTWDNVDFDEQTIRVTQRADRWNTIGSPKSKAARRTIPLAPIVLNVLREWRLRCPHGELGLVFPNGRGNIEAQSNVYRRGFVPLMAECGLCDEEGKPQFTFHTLRHIAASLIIEQGWQPKRVQTVMGHSSMAMTFDRYGHLFSTPEDDKRSMREIQARLLG
ncbi:MAG: site-specific integrase [Alphaproteobacteria bacterium]|nr:site-specific integrase [Alphaproteobacteria bacterium]